MPITRILSVALSIFAIDRLLKIWTVEWMDLRNLYVIEVWPPYFTLKMGWNEGINFGLFGSGSDITKWLLVGIGVAISVMLVIWFRKAKGLWLQLSVGMVVGGAVGNIFDRLTYGAVADFLNVSCCGYNNPYAFNSADVAIFIGVVGLIFLDESPKKKKKRKA